MKITKVVDITDDLDEDAIYHIMSVMDIPRDSMAIYFVEVAETLDILKDNQGEYGNALAVKAFKLAHKNHRGMPVLITDIPGN